MCQRIPQTFLEATYGVRIRTRPLEEGGTGVPTAEELLIAYAKARGFTKTGQGQPDESRAARYILKDYVAGKLLFCHPPPTDPVTDPYAFNLEHYRREPEGISQVVESRPTALDSIEDSMTSPSIEGQHLMSSPFPQSEKSSKLDKKFFEATRGNAGHLVRPFNHKYTEQGAASEKQLSGRKQRTLVALANGIDPADAARMNHKKHFKGRKGRTDSGVED